MNFLIVYGIMVVFTIGVTQGGAEEHEKMGLMDFVFSLVWPIFLGICFGVFFKNVYDLSKHFTNKS